MTLPSIQIHVPILLSTVICPITQQGVSQQQPNYAQQSSSGQALFQPKHGGNWSPDPVSRLYLSYPFEFAPGCGLSPHQVRLSPTGSTSPSKSLLHSSFLVFATQKEATRSSQNQQPQLQTQEESSSPRHGGCWTPVAAKSPTLKRCLRRRRRSTIF